MKDWQKMEYSNIFSNMNCTSFSELTNLLGLGYSVGEGLHFSQLWLLLSFLQEQHADQFYFCLWSVLVCHPAGGLSQKESRTREPMPLGVSTWKTD